MVLGFVMSELSIAINTCLVESISATYAYYDTIKHPNYCLAAPCLLVPPSWVFLVDIGTARSQGGPVLEQGPRDWEQNQRQEAKEACRPFDGQRIVHYRCMLDRTHTRAQGTPLTLDDEERESRRKCVSSQAVSTCSTSHYAAMVGVC